MSPTTTVSTYINLCQNQTRAVYINSHTVCELLHKIAALGLATPVTLVLDNAAYQRCQLVRHENFRHDSTLPGARANPALHPLGACQPEVQIICPTVTKPMVSLGKEARNAIVPEAREGVNAASAANYDASESTGRNSFGLRLWKKRLGLA